MKTLSNGVVEVTEADLPLSCPPPKSPKWNLHPRVFLPLTAAKPERICPYCGTRYVLATAASGGGDTKK